MDQGSQKRELKFGKNQITIELGKNQTEKGKIMGNLGPIVDQHLYQNPIFASFFSLAPYLN